MDPAEGARGCEDSSGVNTSPGDAPPLLLSGFFKWSLFSVCHSSDELITPTCHSHTQPVSSSFLCFAMYSH